MRKTEKVLPLTEGLATSIILFLKHFDEQNLIPLDMKESRNSPQISDSSQNGKKDEWKKEREEEKGREEKKKEGERRGEKKEKKEKRQDYIAVTHLGFPRGCPHFPETIRWDLGAILNRSHTHFSLCESFVQNHLNKDDVN